MSSSYRRTGLTCFHTCHPRLTDKGAIGMRLAEQQKKRSPGETLFLGRQQQMYEGMARAYIRLWNKLRKLLIYAYLVKDIGLASILQRQFGGWKFQNDKLPRLVDEPGDHPRAREVSLAAYHIHVQRSIFTASSNVPESKQSSGTVYRQRHAHVFQAWLKISAQNTVSNISFTVDYTANTFCESTSDHVVMLCSLTIPWTKHATTCCTELKSSSSFAWSCLSCSIFWKRTQKKPNGSEQIAPSQVATGFLLFSISRSWPRGSIVKAPCPWMITFLPTTFR